MKLPVKCTFCHDVMVTDYEQVPHTAEDSAIITKTCRKRVDHQVTWYATVKDDEVYKVCVKIMRNPLRHATWVFTFKELFIHISGNPPKMIHLPYFEPDLTNYRRLVDKLRTYVTFS